MIVSLHNVVGVKINPFKKQELDWPSYTTEIEITMTDRSGHEYKTVINLFSAKGDQQFSGELLSKQEGKEEAVVEEEEEAVSKGE